MQLSEIVLFHEDSIKSWQISEAVQLYGAIVQCIPAINNHLLPVIKNNHPVSVVIADGLPAAALWWENLGFIRLPARGYCVGYRC